MKAPFTFYATLTLSILLTTPMNPQGLQSGGARNQILEEDERYKQGLQAYQRAAFAQAIEYWEQLLSHWQDGEPWKDKVVILCRIASAYQNLGMNRQSIKNLESALRSAIEFQSQPHIRSVKGQLGIVYTYTLDHKLAEHFLLESLGMAQKEGNLDATALSLMNMGNLRFVQARYHEAMEYYGQSQSIANELINARWVVKLYINAGLAAVMNKQYDESVVLINHGVNKLKHWDDSHEKANLLITAGAGLFQAIKPTIFSEPRKPYSQSFQPVSVRTQGCRTSQ